MAFAPARAARSGIVVLLVWTLAVTALRAARWPNDFAKAHWLVDYRFGIVKRGLMGQMLTLATRLLHARPSEALIAGVSFVIFGALLLTLLWMAVDLIARTAWSGTTVAVMAVFVSSPFIVMSAHLMGYLDHVIVLAAAGAVVLLVRGQVWWAFGVEAAAVFVHEEALLVGFPVLAAVWLTLPPHRRPGARALQRLMPLLLPLVAFGALLAADSALASDHYQQALVHHLARFPFVGGDMHLFVPEWLTTNLAANLGEQAHHFAERISSAGMYGLVMPTVVTLLALAVEMWDTRGAPDMAVLVAAILAPQLMHLVAWDTARIWTDSIVCAFLGLWAIGSTRPVRGPDPLRGLGVLAVGSLLVNVLATTPLLDNLSDRLSLPLRVLLYAPVLVACAWLARDRRTAPERTGRVVGRPDRA